MLNIRLLGKADLPFAMRLVESAGWNQTPADWARLLAIAPEGCFLAEWSGEPAGTATAVAYQADCAWIGMVLVHPEFRRRGIGSALMKHCIEHLRRLGVRTIKLDATEQGRPVYRRLGFRDEYPVNRYWGRPHRRGRVPERVMIEPLARCHWPQIARLDRAAFGADRLRLLEALVADQPEWALVARVDGTMIGFGLARPGRQADYVGPVVAVDPAAAKSLVLALLERIGRRAVFLDSPEPTSDWPAWLASLGFEVQRRLTRMVLGPNDSPGCREKVFALSGFETG